MNCKLQKNYVHILEGQALFNKTKKVNVIAAYKR